MHLQQSHTMEASIPKEPREQQTKHTQAKDSVSTLNDWNKTIVSTLL